MLLYYDIQDLLCEISYIDYDFNQLTFDHFSKVINNNQNRVKVLFSQPVLIERFITKSINELFQG